MQKTTTIFKFVLLLSIVLVLFTNPFFTLKVAFAMPFYDLHPEDLVLRAKFSTSYTNSSNDRKHNIKLAAKSINNTFVDVGGEFSFNLTVGSRTEKRGYKTAKVIVGGEFVDGVGGGVCQVSTTLYNALLLAGMKIIEYHPHSLAVSYVPPSFDAMVNSSYADLKFINDTHNPVILYATATDTTLTISVHGEKTTRTYQRESVLVEEIPFDTEEIYDENLEYPDLFEGQSKTIKYGKNGIKSKGYLVIKENGKTIEKRLLRSDKYKAINSVVIYGKTPLPTPPQLTDYDFLELFKEFYNLLNNKYRKNL